MRPFMIAISSTIVIGALTGWLAAGGGGGTMQDAQTAWSLIERPQSGDSVRLKLYTAMMATGHFGEAAATATAAGGIEDESAPLIAGAWIKDGEIALSFYGLNETFITAGVGDPLPGGWIIKDASLERIVVERNGEMREIAVFPYDIPGI